MTELYRITSAVLSNQGLKRANNEDYLTFYEPGDAQEILNDGQLYIVADGVGGEASGENASRFAAEKVAYEYYQNKQVPPAKRLETAMTLANAEIQAYTKKRELARMATTCVVGVIRQNKLLVANVGDSRGYLIRGGQVTQITQDHNLVGEMSRAGIMTEEQAMESSVKNRLMRSIGGHPEFKVDLFPDIEIQPGDRILFCTDGLTRYAARADIVSIMAMGGSPQEIARRLVDFALGRGGADNVSVALIEIGQLAVLPEHAESRGHKPHPITMEALMEMGQTAAIALPGMAEKTQQIQLSSEVEKAQVEAEKTPPETEKALPEAEKMMPATVKIQPAIEKTQEIQYPPENEKTQEVQKTPETATTQPSIKLPAEPPSIKTVQRVSTRSKIPQPDPFARKKSVSTSRSIIPTILLVLFFVAAVAILAYIAFQIREGVFNLNRATNIPPVTATNTPAPTKTAARLSETAPVATVTVPNAAQTAATATGSTATVTGTIASTSSALPSTYCVKQVSEGQYLKPLIEAFGLTYDANATYKYFICANADFSCKNSPAKDLAPKDHSLIQVGWWIMIQGVDEATCTAKGGKWVAP